MPYHPSYNPDLALSNGNSGRKHLSRPGAVAIWLKKIFLHLKLLVHLSLNAVFNTNSPKLIICQTLKLRERIKTMSCLKVNEGDIHYSFGLCRSTRKFMQSNSTSTFLESIAVKVRPEAKLSYLTTGENWDRYLPTGGQIHDSNQPVEHFLKINFLYWGRSLKMYGASVYNGKVYMYI